MGEVLQWRLVIELSKENSQEHRLRLVPVSRLPHHQLRNVLSRPELEARARRELAAGRRRTLTFYQYCRCEPCHRKVLFLRWGGDAALVTLLVWDTG